MQGQATKLRVGLLLDSFNVEAWAYRPLEQAIQAGHIEISALIVRAPSRPPSPLWRKLIRPRPVKALARMAYMMLERPISNTNALRMRDVRDLAKGAEVLEVTPETGKFTDTIRSEDVEKIQAMDLDVLFRRGFRLLRGDILWVGARYGVWSFHHGDNRVLRGGPAAFWEFVERWPEAGAILQILTEELDGGAVLDKATCQVSDARTWTDLQNRIFWKASPLLMKWLRIFSHRGAGAMTMVRKQQKVFSIYDRRLYRAPGIWILLKLFGRLLKKTTAAAFRKAITPLRDPKRRRPEWGLLYHFCDTSSEAIVLDLRKFKRISPPRGVFWADPFVAEEGHRIALFFEEFSYSDRKGWISSGELTPDGLTAAPRKVIEEDWHMSYPFVFRYEERLYMIPESRDRGQIRLYECKGYPYEWEFHSVLIDNINAVDTTLIERDGEWWMFTSCCTMEPPQDDAQLHLFYAPTPFGPWTPHLLNPVNANLRSARPAGGLIGRGGRLYRLGQDGVAYGSGIRVCEITALTHDEYEEGVIEKIEPKWGKETGIHTLNISSSCIVADYKIY